MNQEIELEEFNFKISTLIKVDETLEMHKTDGLAYRYIH
jgi:hypothetical protein